MPKIEAGLSACKAHALPSVLSLPPPFLFISLKILVLMVIHKNLFESGEFLKGTEHILCIYQIPNLILSLVKKNKQTNKNLYIPRVPEV